MTFSIHDVDVLFIAGFGPIAADAVASRSLYLDTLHLPLKPLGIRAIIWSPIRSME